MRERDGERERENSDPFWSLLKNSQWDSSRVDDAITVRNEIPLIKWLQLRSTTIHSYGACNIVSSGRTLVERDPHENLKRVYSHCLCCNDEDNSGRESEKLQKLCHTALQIAFRVL